MAIYRGPGGAGDAVNDASSETRLAVEARDAAIAAQQAAEAAESAAQSAQAAAELAETNAETAETNAETAATSASSAASAAHTYADNAAASASDAADSATAAATSETNAASSASDASTSASNASTSETNAASSASSASTSATNAASSASSASTSASSASSSASSASTSATNAASSASSASTSASTATTQAGIATTKASEAATSATNASNSASSASTSATNAASSASSASTSASNAATSATSASNSATAASSAQTAAESARDATLAAYDNFDDRYLGAKPNDPTVDNDGNALLTGALYFNTGSGTMKVYNGSAWFSSYVTLSGALVATNNLSDLTVPADARSNLGLGNVTNESKATMFTSPTFTGTSHFTNGVQIDGDLTVSGTTVTINTTNLAVEDNMIYLNEGSTVANPDLGIAGNYNDGTYRHGGVFRDASDGKWKFFKNYVPEPDASSYIDTSHATFALADVQANNFTGTLTGNVTGDVTGNVSGNAGTVTNGVYTSGSYANPSWITGLSETKVLPTQSGNSGKFLTTNGTTSSWTALGSAATTSSTDYATAAQGTKADTAYGWGNHASAGYLTSIADGSVTPAKLSTGHPTWDTSGNLTLDNGSADGAQLVLKSSGYSDWNIDNYSGSLRAYYGSTVYTTLDSSGNFGIGTSSPTEKLTVNGNILSFGNIQTGIGTGAAYQLTYTTANSGSRSWRMVNDYNTYGDFAVLQSTTQTGSTYSPRLLIDSSGNVGIGTSSPTAKTTISAAVGSVATGQLLIKDPSYSGVALAQGSIGEGYLYNISNSYLAIGTNNTERMRLSAAGGLSVGTTADPGAGAIYATGNITAYYSDERLKTKIGNIDNALDKVKQIETMVYHANDKAVELGYDASVIEVGVTAQSVQKVQPEVVVPAPVDQQYLTVRYDRLVPLLIEAIKELEAQVAELKAK